MKTAVKNQQEKSGCDICSLDEAFKDHWIEVVAIFLIFLGILKKIIWLM